MTRARTSHNLDRLLRPKSIAVFGGSWAERVVEQCTKMGFAGHVWPVHPTRASMGGRACHRALDELPGAPDAAFIAVNRRAAVETVGALSQMGAGGAVCFASGFAETDDEGRELQRQLVDAAGAMAVVGPNCYGLINYLDGALLWPDQHGGKRCETGVAILTQSGNIAINLTMNRRAVPIAYIGTLGNQAQVGVADFIAALAADERITAIGIYLEGLSDAQAFSDAVAVAHSHNVAIVVLKAGNSEKGAELALSHTGSLAGTGAVMDAFFARLGVAQVTSIPALMETLKLLHVHGPLPGKTMVSLSCSGGEALVVADAVERTSLDFRAFTAEEKSAIRKTTHDLVSVRNPFDYHTFDWGKWDRVEATFEAVMDCGFDLAGLILEFPREDRCDPLDWTNAADAWGRAAATTGARTAVIATLPELLPEEVGEKLLAAGIAPLYGVDDALAAVDAASDARISGEEENVGLIGVPGSPATGAITPQSEWDAKARLRDVGVRVPDGTLCTVRDEALRAAETHGFPLVAKAVSPTLLHKTEANAVRLDLHDTVGVAAAFDDLVAITGSVLVEQMAPAAVAELIVGVRREPVVGLYLLIGSGGVTAELIRDTAIVLLPADGDAIRAAIGSLKLAPLLTGYRGGPAADIDAAIEVIGRLADFAIANVATLEELEINPLFVHAEGHGATAVDALLVERLPPEI